jgi:hypothetical protein
VGTKRDYSIGDACPSESRLFAGGATFVFLPGYPLFREILCH